MTEQILDYLNWIPVYSTGIWLVLTGILVYTLLQINKELGIKHRIFKIGVLLVAQIWLYPLYTQLFYPLIMGVVGNLITLALTWYYIKQLSLYLPKLSKWMYPQLIWALLATFYTLMVLIDNYSA